MSSRTASEHAGPRALDELKAETQARAERNGYPLIGLHPNDVREALDGIKTLDRDEWANSWMSIGDRYFERAEASEHQDPSTAAVAFLDAWRLYAFGRWPVPNSARKRISAERALEAFRRYALLLDPPVEAVRIPFNRSEIVGYLRLPAGVRPAPVVLIISGLDSRKEDLAERFSWLLSKGIGFFALDAPGTGEAPLPASPEADQIYRLALDYLANRGDVDPGRMAVFGSSFGAYWAVKLAATACDRLIGVVAQSPGIHAAFQFPHLQRTLSNREYLFDLVPAQMSVFSSTTTVEELARQRATLSLSTQGLLETRMAPMLVIAGARDTQTPIDDIELLLRSGTTPKEAWINPRGGHMGREPQGWTDLEIFRRVTVPWLVRVLQ